MVRKIINDNKIDCHIEKTKSYIFSYNGDDYDDFASEILKEKGLDYLSNFVKLHYKNTSKILENPKLDI